MIFSFNESDIFQLVKVMFQKMPLQVFGILMMTMLNS